MTNIYKPGSGGGGSGIETLMGDTGTASGSTVNVIGGIATNHSGGSVSITGDDASTLTLNLSDANSNTFLGEFSGNNSLTSSENVAVGTDALGIVTTSSENVAIGSGALADLTSGSGSNIAIGFETAQLLLTGSDNTIVGSSAGNAYTGAESNNIILGEVTGVTGDSRVMRLGPVSGATSIEKTFVGGVTGTTPTDANVPQVVLCDNTGQLSVTPSETAGYVLTSNGTDAPTFQAAGGGGSATAFYAYASETSVNQDVVGGGFPGPYTIIFDDDSIRNDGGYNHSNGIFTAPSAGFYCFSAVVYFHTDSAFSAGSEAIVSTIGSVNSQVFYQQLTIAAANSAQNLCLPFTWMLNMAMGETVGVQIYCNTASQDVSIIGAPVSPSALTAFSSFSGFKVGT